LQSESHTSGFLVSYEADVVKVVKRLVNDVQDFSLSLILVAFILIDSERSLGTDSTVTVIAVDLGKQRLQTRLGYILLRTHLVVGFQ
jgi:hypothetical protein